MHKESPFGKNIAEKGEKNPVMTVEKEKIEGLTPEGYKEFKKDDFIQAYVGDDRLYLRYLLLAKQVINKEQDISWKNFH